MIKPRNNQLNEISEMKTAKRRILLFEKENGFLFFVLKDKKVILFGEENENDISVGDIYIGRVTNVLKNIDGVFLDIKKKQNCFLATGTSFEYVILNRKIEASKDNNNLHNEDELLIQIKKEAYKTKLPVATTQISISDYEIILNKAKHSYVGECLYKAPSRLIKYLLTNPLVEDEYIITSSNNLYDYLLNNSNYSKFKSSIKKHDDNSLRLSVLYSMKSVIERITDSKVWLPSGGFIVIEQTEAMTVIDVNTGKNIKGKDRENTLLATNLEALLEIVYQISARNLSGIIIIDFINMEKGENRTILQDECKKQFSMANPAIHYVDYTKLGLVEATRNKEYCDIYEFFSKNDKTILL